MAIFNPNVADRSDTTYYAGPIGTNKTADLLAVKMAFTAEATINASRIVKFGAAGVETVLEAAAATDEMFGVSTNTGNAISGDSVDVIVAGIATVVVGAAVNAGDKVTADSDGRAVAAAATNAIVGVALESATAANETIKIAVHVGSM